MIINPDSLFLCQYNFFLMHEPCEKLGDVFSVLLRHEKEIKTELVAMVCLGLGMERFRLPPTCARYAPGICHSSAAFHMRDFKQFAVACLKQSELSARRVNASIKEVDSVQHSIQQLQTSPNVLFSAMVVYTVSIYL